MQTPIMQAQPVLVAALQKHVFEHLTMLAEQMVQQGQPVPQGAPGAPGQEVAGVPPEQRTNLIAQQEAQLMQEFVKLLTPPQQEDPIVELKQQDLALREQELMARVQTDADKLRVSEEQSEQDDAIDRERIRSQQDIAKQRADVALYRTNLAADQKERGL